VEGEERGAQERTQAWRMKKNNRERGLSKSLSVISRGKKERIQLGKKDAACYAEVHGRFRECRQRVSMGGGRAVHGERKSAFAHWHTVARLTGRMRAGSDKEVVRSLPSNGEKFSVLEEDGPLAGMPM